MTSIEDPLTSTASRLYSRKSTWPIEHHLTSQDLHGQTQIRAPTQQDPYPRTPVSEASKDICQKNAPDPNHQQEKETNHAKPKPSTATLLHHLHHTTCVLQHMRPRHQLQTNQSLSKETTIRQPAQNRPQILLRPLQTPQTLSLAGKRRSPRRESARGAAGRTNASAALQVCLYHCDGRGW